MGLIHLTRALVLNEESGFFSIIFMNFLFSWVLVTSRFRFKKVKESIFLQFNFTLDDSLFFHIFLWISISFYFQIMIFFFPFWVLIVFFFSQSSKDHDLFLRYSSKICHEFPFRFTFRLLSFSLFGSWSFIFSHSSIIFMNFLFSWVLMIFQFRFKKFKESIFLQFNFILDDSLFFQNFLWISISFCFQIMIFFPFWILIVFFLSFFKTSSFSLFGSWSFFFQFWKDYDPFSFSDFDRFSFPLVKRLWSFTLFGSWLFFVLLLFKFLEFMFYFESLSNVLFSFSFFLWSFKKFLGSKFYSHFV